MTQIALIGVILFFGGIVIGYAFGRAHDPPVLYWKPIPPPTWTYKTGCDCATPEQETGP